LNITMGTWKLIRRLISSVAGKILIDFIVNEITFTFLQGLKK